jgi:hypothetical protein
MKRRGKKVNLDRAMDLILDVCIVSNVAELLYLGWTYLFMFTEI